MDANNYLSYVELANCLPEAMLFVDVNGVVQAVNKAARRELPVDSLLCRPLWEMVGEPEEKIRNYIGICFRSKDFIPSTLTFEISKIAVSYHVRGSVLVPQRRGEEPGLAVLRLERKEQVVMPFLALNTKLDESVREIRSRRIVEEAFRSAQARFFSLANKTRVIPYESDIEGGRLNFSTLQLAELLVCSPSRLQEENLWEEFAHPEDLPIIRRKLSVLRQQGETEFEYRVISRAGKEIWLLDVCSISRDLQGEERMIGFLLNMTNRKEEEQRRRLEEARTEKFRRGESLTALAAGITHEFNNILVGILGNADLALEELSESSPLRAHLGEICRAAHRASELTGQMIAFTGGASMPEDQPLAVRRLVESAIDATQPVFGDTIAFRLEVPLKLPQVYGDGKQVSLLLNNLMHNACEAMKGKRGRVVVRVLTQELHQEQIDALAYNACEPGTFLVIEVEDSGLGMDPETMHKVLDPFFSTKFTGRGLGLAAAQGILRAHRGALSIESVPGEGTIMRVFLPASAAKGKQNDAVVLNGRSSGKLMALVVDDDPAVQLVMKRILERAGYAVSVAQDGLEAVQCLRSSPDQFALAVLDLVMPRKNGMETYLELRQFLPELPVLICSAYEAPMADADLSGDSRIKFLRKPFSVAAFDDLVKELLEGSEEAV